MFDHEKEEGDERDEVFPLRDPPEDSAREHGPPKGGNPNPPTRPTAQVELSDVEFGGPAPTVEPRVDLSYVRFINRFKGAGMELSMSGEAGGPNLHPNNPIVFLVGTFGLLAVAALSVLSGTFEAVILTTVMIFIGVWSTCLLVQARKGRD